MIDVTNEMEKTPLIEQRADPYVYHHTDGYYYFVASVPEYDRIELRRAWSIAGLEKANPCTIWRKHATGPMSGFIWAPELHFINGKWYIYFAAGQAEDTWYIRTWVLENTSPDPFCGTWEEKGMVVSEWDSFMLDMTVFQHNNQLYGIWAQKSREATENSCLYLAKMRNPYTVEAPLTLLTRPEFDWECKGFRVNEGPAVLKKNGKIFVTFSASATDATYCMGLLYADENADLTDAKNWTKFDKPVLVTDEKKGIFGPGHNSFTTTRDFKEDILVYHARPYAEVDLDFALFDPNRHTWVKKIMWDDKGFPIFQ